MIHLYRETNHGANFLTNLGHFGIFFPVSILDRAPPPLALNLSQDANVMFGCGKKWRRERDGKEFEKRERGDKYGRF